MRGPALTAPAAELWRLLDSHGTHQTDDPSSPVDFTINDDGNATIWTEAST